MSINTYLDDISSKLIIKGEASEAINKSVDTFRNRMKDYFANHEAITLNEVRVFGSYERDTNLPQSVDHSTDVDIMLVMNNDGCTPQTYLDRVRRAVEAKYSTSDIMQSSPTIILSMTHIRFEITPAIVKNNFYHIKNGDNEWMPTYCFADLNYLIEANKANNYMVKPTIRLVKYWNVNKNNKSISSYELEAKLASHFSSNHYYFSNTKKYLLEGLKQIKSLASFDLQRERIEKAISKVQEAIDDEEKYPYVSMDEIKEVITELK